MPHSCDADVPQSTTGIGRVGVVQFRRSLDLAQDVAAELSRAAMTGLAVPQSARLRCNTRSPVRGQRPDRLRPCLQAWSRRHCLEAEGLCLPFGALPRLAQNEERKCPGREARNRGRLGQREMAITQGKIPFVFGMVVLATLLIAAPAAQAACRSPKNICKHFDDCLQRTSDPNNKDTDGIRAGAIAESW